MSIKGPLNTPQGTRRDAAARDAAAAHAPTHAKGTPGTGER